MRVWREVPRVLPLQVQMEDSGGDGLTKTERNGTDKVTRTMAMSVLHHEKHSVQGDRKSVHDLKRSVQDAAERTLTTQDTAPMLRARDDHDHATTIMMTTTGRPHRAAEMTEAGIGLEARGNDHGLRITTLTIAKTGRRVVEILDATLDVMMTGEGARRSAARVRKVTHLVH